MLLPYASDRPPANPPLAVVALVLINFAVFGIVAFAVLTRGEAAPVAWFAALSLVPASLHWYAPLTYSFLHEHVLHLSANMLFLWVFGSSVEDAVGWKRFAALYLAAAATAGLLQAGMALVMGGAARTIPIIGASGAVSAIVGVFAVRFYRSRIRFIGLPFRIPAVVLLVTVMLVEMAAALWGITHRGPESGGQLAAHWAHVGGFVLGVLWARLTGMMLAGRIEYLAADGAAEMERGLPIRAAQRWQAVLRADPGNTRARAELARASALAGDREQGLSGYRDAIGALLRSGDRAEAAHRFLEMTEFFPGEKLGNSEQLAIGSALEEQGEWLAALDVFRSLADAGPHTRETEMAALRAGVILLRKMGKPVQAAERLAAFLVSYPQSEWRSYAEDLLRAARKSAAASPPAE